MGNPRPAPPQVAAAFVLPKCVSQEFALRTIKEQLPGARVVFDPAARSYVVFQHEWQPPCPDHTLDLYVTRTVHDILATAIAREHVEVTYFQSSRVETV